MNVAKMNAAVVDMFLACDLQAAIKLADINEAIVQDEIDTFDQRTAELNQLLTDFRANRDRLPKLVVGSHEYQEAFRVLETYRHELEIRGQYDEVMSLLLNRLHPIKWHSI